MDHQRAADILGVVDVDGDASRDVAVNIAAAKGIGHGAAVEVEGDIASDICRVGRGITSTALRATEDIGVGATNDVEGDIALDVGHIGTTIEGANVYVSA